MKRLILFLIRRRLGLKKWEGFRFVGQRSKDDWYVFTNDKLLKVCHDRGPTLIIPSNVRLNWLIDDECRIRKINVRFDKKKYWA